MKGEHLAILCTFLLMPLLAVSLAICLHSSRR